MNESPPRRERPYNYTRGNTASMALEWLPPTCVAGRGSHSKWSRCSDGWHMQDDEFLAERPGGWESAEVLRKHAEWTAAHVASTLEGSHDLVRAFAAALEQRETIATTAPREITTLIEANGFSVAVKRMEVLWHPEHAKRSTVEKDLERAKRAHGYAAVAIELARVSVHRFRQHRDHDAIPEALMAAALTLIATVKATNERSDETLVQSISEAERLVESAERAARERHKAVNARVEAARAVERRDVARARTAADAQTAADDAEARWDKDVMARHRQPATVRGENSDGGAGLRPARTSKDEGPRGGRQRNDAQEDLTRAAVERKQANANANDVRVARMARRQQLTQL